MRKIFFILLFTLLLLPNFVFAAPDIGLGANSTVSKIADKAGYDKVTDTTLSETIGKYIRVILSLSGTIFLALTVYAGFLWMTASGNEEQVTKATGIIKMATIGLIITLAAFSITAFVIAKVGSSTQSAPPPIGGGGAGGPAPAQKCDSWFGDWGCGWAKQSEKPL